MIKKWYSVALGVITLFILTGLTFNHISPYGSVTIGIIVGYIVALLIDKNTKL